MAKSFASDIKKNKAKIEDSTLASENSRLREKLELSKSDISLMKLSELKLRTNIRDDEFKYKYEDINNLADDIELNGQHTPVLISKDGYLLFGFRRYYAKKLLAKEGRGSDDILVYRYQKASKEISENELYDLQFSENNQRRDIDNFQLSKLYTDLIKNNKDLDQNKLAEKFKKQKSFISMIINIQNIDPVLVKFLKEFQVFGWSQAKFNMLNFEKVDYELDSKLVKEYEKLKGNIGIRKLSNIAKNDSIEQQKKLFLKNYGNRLTSEELKEPYFSGIELDAKKEKTISSKGTKAINDILKMLENAEGLEAEEYTSVRKSLELAQKKLEKLTV